ncbi:hypothetical protein DB29_02648 [Shouchella clausii]|nr:hypothetical protein DB29_02648 [Shouchella clausii]
MSAWIEICISRKRAKKGGVALFVSAWIEIHSLWIGHR